MPLVRVFCSKGRVFKAVEFVRSAVKKHGVVPWEKTYEEILDCLSKLKKRCQYNIKTITT